MSDLREVTYDFDIDQIVAVRAEVGTDPDTLIAEAKSKLLWLIQNDHVTFQFCNVFDDDTGGMYEEWNEVPKEVSEQTLVLQSRYVGRVCVLVAVATVVHGFVFLMEDSDEFLNSSREIA